MTEIQIDVTQEDIKKGSSCSHCPIARAALRALNATHISVSPLWLEWAMNGPNSWQCVSMPEVGREFIRRFDNDSEVQPFSFSVTL